MARSGDFSCVHQIGENRSGEDSCEFPSRGNIPPAFSKSGKTQRRNCLLANLPAMTRSGGFLWNNFTHLAVYSDDVVAAVTYHRLHPSPTLYTLGPAQAGYTLGPA